MRLSLRAEREPDGRRPFKLLEREPLPTSYGEDSYRRIFRAVEWPPRDITRRHPWRDVLFTASRIR
jgi:hypothetical protein